jgi:cytochrome P450
MREAPELTVHRSVTKGLRLFDADRLRWLDEAAAAGPVVALKMGPLRLCVVTDAEAARTMLVTESGSWRRPPATTVPIRVAIGENLFTQADKVWARLQPAVAPNFRKKAIDARITGADEVIAAAVDAIPVDTTVDLDVAMGRIALMLAAWIMLGERLEPVRADEITYHQRHAVHWVGAQLGKVTGFLPIAPGAAGRAMKSHRDVLRAYADEVVTRRQSAAGSDDDVLGALMNARPGGKPLSPPQLRSHVLGLFLAGNETTAASLSWSLVHAARHPDDWRRVRDDPQRWSLPFVHETLRVTPAVWGIPRTPTKPGMVVRAGGTQMLVRRSGVATINLRGIHRDPLVWPDPERFDVTRHDPTHDEADAKEKQRGLLSFGLGPRGCIGQQLAIAEMRAVLPALARRGDLVVDDAIVPDPEFALRVRGGLRGRFVEAAPAPVSPDC